MAGIENEFDWDEYKSYIVFQKAAYGLSDENIKSLKLSGIRENLTLQSNGEYLSYKTVSSFYLKIDDQSLEISKRDDQITLLVINNVWYHVAMKSYPHTQIQTIRVVDGITTISLLDQTESYS